MTTITTHFNFIQSKIESLLATEKRTTYYDTKVSGLCVIIYPKCSTKTFFLYKRVDGRPTRIKLGRFPDLSVENARDAALQLNTAIAKGDYQSRKEGTINDNTIFGDLLATYVALHAKLHTKTWKEHERDIEKNCKKWFNRRISSINQFEIQKLHTKVGQHSGIYAANRLLERIRAMYNKAIEWGWQDKNPALNIKKFREKSRDRFLQSDELPRFFAALASEENIVLRDYILLSLFTGARRSNVLAMRWDQINLESAIWRIPETKNGTPQTIPLIVKALEILRKRQDGCNSEWVFPSDSKSGHMEDPKKGWRRILKRAELTDLRIHDLRRTLGSVLAATGANSFLIGQVLNHKDIASTAIYARLNIDPVRECIEVATNKMFGIIDED